MAKAWDYKLQQCFVSKILIQDKRITPKLLFKYGESLIHLTMGEILNRCFDAKKDLLIQREEKTPNQAKAGTKRSTMVQKESFCPLGLLRPPQKRKNILVQDEF